MEDNSSKVPYGSILSMKHTPSDILRAANVLVTANEAALNELPRHIYYHFYNEISIAFLNWIGRGKNDAIEETLDSLTKLIFNDIDLVSPSGLTIKQRLGMQLRSHCAIMSLYLKVHTSVGYNAMLVGPDNKLRKLLLQVLFHLADQKVFNQATFSLQIIQNELKKNNFLSNEIYDLQNIKNVLEWLVEQGLAYEDKSQLNKSYRLSDRGFIECGIHFVSKIKPPQPINLSDNTLNKNTTSSSLLGIPFERSFDLGDHTGRPNDAYGLRSQNIKRKINANVLSIESSEENNQENKFLKEFDENYKSIK